LFRKQSVWLLIEAHLLALVIALFLVNCSHAVRMQAKTVAVVQKTSVDGVGHAYLQYCTVVRKPKCIAEDKAASDAGAPQTKQDRIQCLRPCDSATATKIQKAVDLVRTAQTALFVALQKNASPDELGESRTQLRRAAEDLMRLLRDEGVLDELGRAVDDGRTRITDR
jgi:hypothetical protein